MKNKLHQFLTVAMAFLVLLSSTGFAFVEHQCMVRGKSMELLAEKKADTSMSSCCAKRKAAREASGTFFKKTDCCKESHKFEKLDVAAFEHNIIKSYKNLSPGTTWAATSFIFLRAEWTLPPHEPQAPDISFSSRLHGRGMLAHIQSFLI